MKLSYLNWKDHISMISQKISKPCGIIYRIRNTLDIKSKRLIYYSPIHPYLTDCVNVWSSTYRTNLRGGLTFKFNIFIIQFREKCSKQNMKKTFRENVFVCEDVSLNRKENELHGKYRFFGGSTEKNKDPPIL